MDLFIEPNLIIEVGYLIELWKYDFFKNHGYKVLYFANIEVYTKEILRNTVNKIITILKNETNYVKARK